MTNGKTAADNPLVAVFAGSRDYRVLGTGLKTLKIYYIRSSDANVPENFTDDASSFVKQRLTGDEATVDPGCGHAVLVALGDYREIMTWHPYGEGLREAIIRGYDRTGDEYVPRLCAEHTEGREVTSVIEAFETELVQALLRASAADPKRSDAYLSLYLEAKRIGAI